MNAKTNTYGVIGLMSGTSLDGVDITYVHFARKASGWNFQIKAAATYPYPENWMGKLAFNPDLSATDLLRLDHEYGNYLSHQIEHFIRENAIDKAAIALIASHGHTLYHQPQDGYTLQIGNGAEIFVTTGITTVCDFRKQDIAMGGQGAPLVPIGDALLFPAYDGCINLGGFANISFGSYPEKTAFDICPVNYVLNRLAQKTGQNYDCDGKTARRGSIHQNLLQELDSLQFYRQPPPKSLGAEWVKIYIDPLLHRSALPVEDQLATFVRHIANQVGRVVRENNLSKVLFSGGGVYNKYLLELIRKEAPGEVIIPSREIINFKEALIFGFMGVLRLRREVNILHSVTGAFKDHSSGVVYQ